MPTPGMPASPRTPSRERDPDRPAAAIGGLLGLVALKGAAANEAIPAEVTAAIREKVGAAEASEGGITLKVPDTAENGAFVPVTVTVHSAMRGEDRCTAIHLFATRNPTTRASPATSSGRALRAPR